MLQELLGNVVVLRWLLLHCPAFGRVKFGHPCESGHKSLWIQNKDGLWFEVRISIYDDSTAGHNSFWQREAEIFCSLSCCPWSGNCTRQIVQGKMLVSEVLQQKCSSTSFFAFLICSKFCVNLCLKKYWNLCADFSIYAGLFITQRFVNSLCVVFETGVCNSASGSTGEIKQLKSIVGMAWHVWCCLRWSFCPALARGQGVIYIVLFLPMPHEHRKWHQLADA